MALLFADPCGAFYANMAQAQQGFGYSNLTAFTVKTSGLPTGNVEPTCWDLSGANATGFINLPVATNPGPYYFGGRFYFSPLPADNFPIFQWRNSSQQGQTTFAIRSNGSISAYRGNQSQTLLGSTPTGLIAAGVWNYIEVSQFINATTGTVAIRVNNLSQFNFTGNTYNTGNVDIAYANILGNPVGGVQYVQSVYLTDSTGSRNNGFLGDVTMPIYQPNAAGNFSQYTPQGAATLWQSVNSITPNDANFALDSTPGNRFDVRYPATSFTGVLLGLAHISRVQKSDTGARTFSQTLTSGGVDVIGPASAPGTTFAYYTQIQEVDPATGFPWTAAGFNAMTAGLKTVS